MYRLPPDKIWRRFSESNWLGSLWTSFNLDLKTNKGAVRISPRTIVNTDDIADLGVPVAFATFTDVDQGVQSYWAVAGSYIFKAGTSNAYITAFSKDTSSGAPNGSGAGSSCSSDTSDMVTVGKQYIIVSLRSTLIFFSATDSSNPRWLDVQYDSGGTPDSVAITDGGVHMMCAYGGRVYVTDTDATDLTYTTSVRSVAHNDLVSSSATTTLTTSGSNFLSLARKHWPVTTITFLRPSSSRIWVGTLNQSQDGCWMFAWDGVTASDPNESYFIPDASGLLACVIKDDVPWVLDNNGVLRYFQGGTFTQAPNGRLPVKYPKLLKNSLASTNTRWIHPNGMQIKDGRIRILVNNEYADNGTTIEENLASGIWEYDPETGWVHVQSLSYHAASAGSVTDFGQNRVSRVGALYYAKDDSTSSTANGTCLIGAQLYSDASSTKEVILTDDSNDTLRKSGYFITPKIASSEIKDVWQKLYITLSRRLQNSTDKIVVKFRTYEQDPTEATITWTSTTTFTTTTNVSAFNGYEVEILQGKGGGLCSRITNVSESGGTYTVTIAETATGATSGTAKARFQYWREAAQFTNQTEDVAEFPLTDAGASPWIQLKVFVLCTGKNELGDLILSSKTSQKAE